MGGQYSLIQYTTFRPLPDYWASVLHKRLMGTAVLDVKGSLDPGRSLRVCDLLSKFSVTFNQAPDSFNSQQVDKLSLTRRDTTVLKPFNVLFVCGLTGGERRAGGPAARSQLPAKPQAP